jgi:hypothetical protein
MPTASLTATLSIQLHENISMSTHCSHAVQCIFYPKTNSFKPHIMGTNSFTISKYEINRMIIALSVKARTLFCLISNELNFRCFQDE